MRGSALLHSAAGWLARRSAALLLSVTIAGLAVGGLAWLVGADGIADACWLVSAAFGLAYALWSAVDSLRRGRLGVDVIALLALAGAVAVRELLAAAVISVMLASGRALEAWAALRARQDLSALLDRAPRTARRYRGSSVEVVPLDAVRRATCCSWRRVTWCLWTARSPRAPPFSMSPPLPARHGPPSASAATRCTAAW